jgi:RHS repeat-associated protein
VLTDASGGLLSQEEFLPYGRSSDRRDARNRHRFIGVERDEDTGLCMTGPRTYDPGVGRFLQGDPVVGARSPFEYSSSNPVGRRDGNGYADAAATATYNANRAFDREALAPLASQAGYDDVNSFLDAVESTAVDGVARVQAGADVDVTIAFREPGAESVSFAAPLEAAVGMYLDSPLGWVPRQTAEAVASVPGVAAALDSPAAKSLGVMGGDLMFVGAVRKAVMANRGRAGEFLADELGHTDPTKLIPGASKAVASAWTPGKQLWSKGKLGQHFLKHGDEVGAATRTAYSDAAKAFGSAENTGQFLDTTVGAYFYRFEPATNKVFVGTTAGQKIKTFYKWDGRADDAVITALQEAGKL